MSRGIATVVGALVVLAGGQSVAGTEVNLDRLPAEYSLGNAHVAIVERDYERARRHLADVLAAAPDSWEAHRLMGDCLVALGRPGEALPHYREWVHRRPADADAARAVESTIDRVRKLEDQRQARERERAAALRAHTDTPPLGTLSRVRASSASRAPVYVLHGEPGFADTSAPKVPAESAPGLLESMRQRAEWVMRPGMEAVASEARQLQQVRRQYDDACLGRTTATTQDGVRSGHAVTVSGSHNPNTGREGPRRWSETSWVERWRTVDTTRNEETPQCRALASDIAAYSSAVSGVLAGFESVLASPPSVYPGIREEVFYRLVGELW
jgi:hypothetical protein